MTRTTYTAKLPKIDKSANREVRKPDAYQEFILWTALPPTEKGRHDFQTQEEFSENYKLGKNTLTKWKARKDFQEQVTELRRQWAFDKTGEIIQGIYLAAIKGNPFSQKIWLEYFLDFREKAAEGTKTGATQTNIGVGDIRYLIEQLPEPLKEKHYANLRELLDDASTHRNTLSAQDSDWDERPPQDVPDEADHDAQYLQIAPANEIPKSNSLGLRCNLVREIHAYNHQSSAWRGQE